MLIRACVSACVLFAPGLIGTCMAEANTPFVPDEWRYGRRQDESTLTYCVDKRDPDWPIARKIGEALAGALLLEPKEALIEGRPVLEEIDNLYRVLRETCDVYLGFRLIAQAYPDWMMLTRPYYLAGHLVVVAEPAWKTLSDIPSTRPIGTTLGTSADLRLVQFLQSTAEAERWPRYPMASDEAVLRAVMAGTIGAGLVWAPSFWSHKQADPSLSKLRIIAPKPLSLSMVGVGAALLSRETFLRAAVDNAIAALTADGTIRSIIEEAGFPASEAK
jgi:polar amino acid transport system substrate-binding protein